jgi:hypothetical protein
MKKKKKKKKERKKEKNERKGEKRREWAEWREREREGKEEWRVKEGSGWGEVGRVGGARSIVPSSGGGGLDEGPVAEGRGPAFFLFLFCDVYFVILFSFLYTALPLSLFFLYVRCAIGLVPVVAIWLLGVGGGRLFGWG